MSPVNLSDLPIATSASNSDVTLLRKGGTTDYQCDVGLIRTIDIASLSALPGASSSAEETDLFLIQRASSNYKITFNRVGLLKGVKMWFFLNAPPASNWTIVQGTGDRLLAVSTSNNKYNSLDAGVSSNLNKWQQLDHTLTTSQIPAHTHKFTSSSDNLDGAGSRFYRSGKSDHAHGEYASTSTGGGLGHNHGSLWRPAANIGSIYMKNS